MTTMDKITEEISHFIGLFHTTIEDVRLREAYTDFSYYVTQQPLRVEPVFDSSFEAPFEFLGFDPGVSYKAPAYVKPITHPAFLSHIEHPPIPLVDGQREFPHMDLPKDLGPVGPRTMSVTLEIDPPGSVANYMVQAAGLSDDDYFNVGGSGLIFKPDPVDDADLLEVAEDILSQSPIGDPDMPGSGEEMVELIETIASQLKSWTAEAEGPMEVFVHQATTIEGIYVNGELVSEAPKLSDYHSFDDEEEGDDDPEDGPEPNVVVHADGTVTIDVSVEVVAGSNTVVNNAVMQNLWAAATVTAVLGDHFEINAVIQINAIWDMDAITSAIGSWTNDGAPNEIFNVATFERFDTLEEDVAQPVTGGFPSAWAITEIQGDLMIANWLEQYVFVSDNDIGILSSSGVTTSVIAGDNTSTNHVSLYELGLSYDLIIVGGSVYDANIIHQFNLLFDNDVVGAVSGFETAGNGSFSGSGNLLWNQAYIYNIGADRFEALPSAYLDAANGIAAGRNSLPNGVLTDPAFAGMEGLRVLYISGDLLNIQYIRQTTIMGDDDQIALAMNAINPHPDASWTVSTGDNALINTAAILDLDSMGKTYVGGEQYSQETLIQAELISSEPELAARDPNELVNEAVVFLDDSMLAAESDAPGLPAPEHDSHYQNDGLQHVLG
ncbi:hypothetical protein [Rhizobium sp. LCM 4573]|uniref:hypothetical protein n=1 Tax=Rhizobium sp. LCM 4573 TaxID=1848291 RepID=UPI0008DA3A9E|nr:hypothetical protein [Rhizobium sp. LCM 4573]OHV85003.1 hypothetical protein LCM4573_05030 [Rhizobium sp. LCM 4573]